MSHKVKITLSFEPKTLDAREHIKAIVERGVDEMQNLMVEWADIFPMQCKIVRTRVRKAKEEAAA